MSKTIVLSQDTWIDDKFYRRGEVVPVDDSFNENIKEVINPDLESQVIPEEENGTN